MGQILTKKKNSPQNEPHTANVWFSVVLKHFRANSLKIPLFCQKSDYLRKDHKNTQKVFFLTNMNRGKPSRKLGFI